MALSKKDAGKKQDGTSAPPPSPKPAAAPAAKKKKGGKKRKGRKGKKKQLSAEERRRLEAAKWQAVRPQLLAERIAQSKPEMPYFLQVEYALLADRALQRREQEKSQKRQQALEEKQLKEREHMTVVDERHFDYLEDKYQKALKNWIDVEHKRGTIHERHLQKVKDISKTLYLKKQDVCRRFREQEKKDKMLFKDEARVGRILSAKYKD